MMTLFQELSWLKRHKGALLILIGAPVLYAFFYPLPYQHAVVDSIPLVVWDAEQSATSRDWIAQLDAHPKLDVLDVLPGEPSQERWQRFGQAQAYVHIPAYSAERLAHQQQVVIAYGGNADNFLVYSTAMRAIAETLQHLNLSYAEQSLLQQQGNALLAAQQAEPIRLSVTTLFNDNASYMQYLVPAVFLVIVQQVIMMALGMHWGYRFEMQRPSGPIISVWLAHIAIYLVSGLALILFFYHYILPMQGVQIGGSGLVLLSVAIPFVLSVIGFAMVLTIGFREQETAIVWLLPLSVPLLLMSGASWPSFAMSGWVQAMAPWVPSTWGVNAMIDVAFMNHLPDYAQGWRNAGVWLSLGLLSRVLVADKLPAVARSTV